MIEEIRLLEELAANAWPAEVVQVVDGWRLRYTYGATRRANSVWPNRSYGGMALEEKLRLVEDFYARYEAVTRVKMCPAAQPSNLDTWLERRGYVETDRVAVQTAAISDVLAKTQANWTFAVEINEGPSDTWLRTYHDGDGHDAHTTSVREGILKRIGPRTGFALLEIEGHAAAVGLGVVERGWVGVFCMVTSPEQRRRGAASTLLHALANWGRAHKANAMYLQVMEGNQAAIELYAKAGFATQYHYHYREKRTSPS